MTLSTLTASEWCWRRLKDAGGTQNAGGAWKTLSIADKFPVEQNIRLIDGPNAAQMRHRCPPALSARA
jgi:hypothetical protein